MARFALLLFCMWLLFLVFAGQGWEQAQQHSHSRAAHNVLGWTLPKRPDVITMMCEFGTSTADGC